MRPGTPGFNIGLITSTLIDFDHDHPFHPHHLHDLHDHHDNQSQDVEYIGEDPNLHNRVCGLRVPNLDSMDNSIWTVEVMYKMYKLQKERKNEKG